MKRRRALLGLGLSLALLVVIDQVALWTVLGDDRLFGRAVAPFDPPLFSPAQFANLEKVRAALAESDAEDPGFRYDPDLGWCTPKNGGSGDYRYDWAGCRIGAGPLPRKKAPGVRRIVLLGCSMTHGDEVGPTESWGAVLDELRDDIEVANLGVPAYGLDQALLRYQRDGVGLDADEVWMGLLPEATLRVNNVFRPVLRHWSLDVGFKPRFVLDEDEALVPVPNPARSLEHIVELLDDQDAFLAAVAGLEPGVDRAPIAYAPRGSHVLHHTFLGRVALTAHEAGGRDRPTHLAGPDQETYRLLRAVVLRGAVVARNQSATFRLLVLPGRRGLEQRAADGRGYWEALTADLTAEGVEVLDLSSTLVDANLPYDKLFERRGHYTPRGNRIVAEFLDARLPR